MTQNIKSQQFKSILKAIMLDITEFISVMSVRKQK